MLRSGGNTIHHRGETARRRKTPQVATGLSLSPFGLWQVGENRYYVHRHQAVLWLCARQIAPSLKAVGLIAGALVVVLAMLGLVNAIRLDMLL